MATQLPQGVGKDYLKLTSCNTTGLVRAVDALDRSFGVTKVAITIIRRVADPGDTHRGLVDCLQIEPIPNHQAKDLMHIMPHVDATGILVHTPVTTGTSSRWWPPSSASPPRRRRWMCSGRTRGCGWCAWPTASPPTPRCSTTPASWATPG